MYHCLFVGVAALASPLFEEFKAEYSVVYETAEEHEYRQRVFETTADKTLDRERVLSGLVTA